MEAERSVEPIGTNMTCGLAYFSDFASRRLASRSGSQLSFTPNLPLFAGDHGGAVIPVPIPNTEVKGSIAEGSASPGRARVGRRQLFLCPFAKGFFGIIVFLERHVVFRNKYAMTYFRQEIEGEAK